jgi:hypothetical protein
LAVAVAVQGPLVFLRLFLRRLERVEQEFHHPLLVLQCFMEAAAVGVVFI